jgi:hypothetical protein
VTRSSLALALLLLGSPALAQSTGVDRDQLTALHRIAAAREVCGFPMSGAERTRLDEATALLRTKTAMTESEAAAAYETVRKRVEAERRPDTCATDGAFFQVYRTALDALTPASETAPGVGAPASRS